MAVKKNAAMGAVAKVAAVKASPYLTVTDTLRKRIATAHKAAAKLNTEYHLLAVSAILHVAEHGNPAVIQELYDGLSKNYQTGFKSWVSRLSSDMAAPNGQGEGNGFLRMVKNKFEVINDRMDARKALKDKIDDVFADKPFFDYRLDNGVKAFGPDEVLNRLAQIVKSMEKDENKENFDPIMVQTISAAYRQMSALVPLPGAQAPAAPAIH